MPFPKPGIDQRLEYRSQVELRQIAPAKVLEGGHLHILPHKVTSIQDLPVERPGIVGSVQLIRCLGAGQDGHTAIGHHLNEGIGKPVPWILTCQHDAGDGRPDGAVFVLPGHSELHKQILAGITGTRRRKALPETGDEIIQGSTMDDLLIAADQTRLAALLVSLQDVPLPDGFLPRRLGADGLHRQDNPL